VPELSARAGGGGSTGVRLPARQRGAPGLRTGVTEPKEPETGVDRLGDSIECLSFGARVCVRRRAHGDVSMQLS